LKLLSLLSRQSHPARMGTIAVPTYRVDATAPKHGHAEIVSAHTFEAGTLAEAMLAADEWALQRKFDRPKVTRFRIVRADMILAERPVEARTWVISSIR
jgi:hypothetical protein